jgi:hypothetical protein
MSPSEWASHYVSSYFCLSFTPSLLTECTTLEIISLFKCSRDSLFVLQFLTRAESLCHSLALSLASVTLAFGRQRRQEGSKRRSENPALATWQVWDQPSLNQPEQNISQCKFKSLRSINDKIASIQSVISSSSVLLLLLFYMWKYKYDYDTFSSQICIIKCFLLWLVPSPRSIFDPPNKKGVKPHTCTHSPDWCSSALCLAGLSSQSSDDVGECKEERLPWEIEQMLFGITAPHPLSHSYQVAGRRIHLVAEYSCTWEVSLSPLQGSLARVIC